MVDIASIVLSGLQCVGGIVPQQVKDKVSLTVSHVILYRCNAADIPIKLEELKLAKVELEARLLVAETNGDQIRDAIQRWLNTTDEILLEYEGADERFWCGSSSCQAGKMLDEIKKVMEKSKGFEWVSCPTTPPIGSRYHAYNNSLVSREGKLAEIFTALENSSMIGLCGIPGVGKTTLLEELIKRAEADKMFQVIDKLDLSRGLDVKVIQDSIAKRIQLDLTDCGDDEETRANKLYHGLEKRLLYGKSKILLIFDHVFSASDFSLTRIGIPSLIDGCKILVSARSSEVVTQTEGMCETVHLNCLSPAEAKVLFRHKLGDRISDEVYNSEAYMSNENSILQSCGNLPKAITATAEALKVRWSRLDDIVRDLRKYDLSQDDGVKKTLNQVNKMLLNLLEDDREKKIFLLCCLFQPGTSIPVESLIRFGIGLKLFSTVTKLDDIMEQAYLLVNRLKSLRLLECNDGCIGMNAILHEFAISTALEEKYLLIDEGDRNDNTRENFTIISSTTNSGIHGSKSAHRHLNGFNSQNLEAMFLKGGSSNLQDFDFARMNNLRVLVMTEMKLSTLPPSIGCLRNLFTFCVEYCEIQDASIVGVLLGLEVLSFHGSKLEAFPSGITNLRKLRVLDLAECCFGTTPDDVISNLSQLEGLVRDLKQFSLLEALEIEIPSRNAGNLSLGHNLPSFKIAIGCKITSPYRNHPDRVLLLQDIDASIYMQQGLQILLKETEFLKLVEIKDLRSVYYHLDSKGFVDLKSLHISSCNQMRCVLNGNGDIDVNILPKLETLSLEQLDGLEVIYTGRMPQNWCSQLRELKLLNLKELKCYALLVEHARKLVEVEVTGCPKLNYFFSTCSTSEISSTGDLYDLPFLKKLDLHRLPALKGMWTDKKQESDIKNQTDQLLFHEKISLTALEELYLSSLDNIKELWSEEIREGNPAFQSLKEISIMDCILLESLCTPYVLAALSGLVTLQISFCSNMKEVIKEENNSENGLKFPSLQRMKLKKLQSLKCFSKGSCSAEFPSLEKLSLSSLPKMLSFHESEQSAPRQSPFITEIVFPNLENLKLTDMEGVEELIEEEHCATAFENLKALTIINLGKLKCIPAALLEKLIQLKIHACGSLQGLFDCNFATSMSKLTSLELVDVSCCENVPWKLIPNIQSLVIRRSLLNLESMLSPTEILGCGVAQKLQYMDIEGCDLLKRIVSDECDQDDQALLNYGTAMFPQLKRIKFHALPSMITFSSGCYETTIPKLEKVEISDCPNLVSFSLGILHTDNLSTLILDGDSIPMILDGDCIPINLQERNLNYILEGRNQGDDDDDIVVVAATDDDDDDDDGGGYEDNEMHPSESRLTTNDDGDAHSADASNDDDEDETHSSKSPLVIDDNGDVGSIANDDENEVHPTENKMYPSGSLLATNDESDAHLAAATNDDDEHEMCPSESQLTINDDGDAHFPAADDNDEHEMRPNKSHHTTNDDSGAHSSAADDNDEHQMRPNKSHHTTNDDSGAHSSAADDNDEHEMRPNKSHHTTNDDSGAHSSAADDNDEHKMRPSKSQLTTNDDGDAHSFASTNDDNEQEMHPSKSLPIIDDVGTSDSVVVAAAANNGADHTSHNSGSTEFVELNEGPAQGVENFGQNLNCTSSRDTVKNGYQVNVVERLS